MMITHFEQHPLTRFVHALATVVSITIYVTVVVALPSFSGPLEVLSCRHMRVIDVSHKLLRVLIYRKW